MIAELHDTVNDVTVATDRRIQATFSIQEGSGEVTPFQVVFEEGQSTATTEFRPKEWGRVVVAGRIPDRPEGLVEITIAFAAIAVATGLVGGTVGGALSWLTKKERWWRIPVGTVTGAALFLALLYLGADAILDTSPELDPLNPYAVFFITLLGGWGGTAVLNWLLQKVGVNA